MVVSKIFYFQPLPGEMIQFDSYFSTGLKPPTRFYLLTTKMPRLQVWGLLYYSYTTVHMLGQRILWLLARFVVEPPGIDVGDRDFACCWP